MNEELVYSVKRYEENGEQKKSKKPVGEISDNQLELYMFPEIQLHIEPSEDNTQYEKVFLVRTFELDGETETRYNYVGFTRQTKHQKYLNLNMFPESEFVINTLTGKTEPETISS